MTASTVSGVRAATEADAEAMAAIHHEGIAERQATFETDELSPAEVAGWVGRDHEPLLVAEFDGQVAGFARVMRSSDRCATSGVGEYTIYLAAASVALARRAGFRKVGVHKRHGRLDGEWKDLLIVERLIADALAEED